MNCVRNQNTIKKFENNLIHIQIELQNQGENIKIQRTKLSSKLSSKLTYFSNLENVFNVVWNLITTHP